MFTGLVRHVGRVVARLPRGGDLRLRIDLGVLAAEAELGASIAVDGVCLTVCERDGAVADFDCSAHTVSRTTLGERRTGDRVNLEPALAVGDRLGGHLVSGHVDGIGRVLERRREGGGERFTFLLPESGAVRVVEKGSVAIDGISLTTWDCRGARFQVALIPHTLAHTTLGERRPGDRVNMEQDQIGRWVQQLAEPWTGDLA